ncbi:MAG: acyl-CoA dehydrogenase family protein, partial [Woeseiaceae bacterium]|nr:acyl-CoA dehydrogenase family protein [Woeseiaceae bacterium]
MNVTFTTAENEFRSEVRKYFKEEFPQDVLGKQRKAIPLTREDTVRWHKNIYRKGWAAPSWPVEYGGTGWSSVQKYIFADEQARASAPAFLPFGISMVGPIIYTFGNDEQKKRFLPDILEFNTWW